MNEHFRRYAEKISQAAGTPWAFMVATTIVVWGVLGPTFHYSDTWQLIINTGTTVITFLMVFLIQNTQDCESRLKLDELIRGVGGARTSFVSLDSMSDMELDEIQRNSSVCGRNTLPWSMMISRPFNRSAKCGTSVATSRGNKRSRICFRP